ncbi:hypothetical protein [Streptomyces sp. NPDC006274]|uniref:hypothetical protein n=1 Tax=unclassified Streptomyces TaxID=2593676 RepID=UPI0033AC50FC
MSGVCWLDCRRDGVRVLWVGSVNTPGATGDVYACGPCIAELAHMVRVQSHVRDGAENRTEREPATYAVPVHAPPPATTRTCEHRQTEKRDGKTCCRACQRQLYL